MAPVIWGLDLKEITWAKFGNRNMWSNRYHLRRTKFIIYQLAMIFCVVSESLGTAAMTDYLDQSERINQLDSRAHVYNNDYVGVASYNIFAGVFVAFVFGSAFFFDLIWPERHESLAVRTAWRICSILAILFEGGSAFALTIITATRAAYPYGVDETRMAYLLSKAKYSPFEYNHNHRAIAACVFIWPGWLMVIAGTIILWLSMANEDRYGTTVAAHLRGGNEKVELGSHEINGHNGQSTSTYGHHNVTPPSQTHVHGSSEAPLVGQSEQSIEPETDRTAQQLRSMTGDNTAGTDAHVSAGSRRGLPENGAGNGAAEMSA